MAKSLGRGGGSLHLSVYFVRAVRCIADILQPDSKHHLLALVLEPKLVCLLGSKGETLSSIGDELHLVTFFCTRPGIKFMEGEPMNPATNRFAGWL